MLKQCSKNARKMLKKAKKMLKNCEKEPRFYAFLRVCQSKPESGRQYLADLMMHPIQVKPKK